MGNKKTDAIEDIIAELNAGTLTEERLRSVFRNVFDKNERKQDLLYLQSGTTGLDTDLVGMSMIRDGEIDYGSANKDEWPYKSVLDAIRDGWRVISFPNLALLMDDTKTFGLGFEFILEKWS